MSKSKGSRPFLVTVLAILFLISGTLSVLGGIATFTGLAVFGEAEAGALSGGTLMIVGALSLLVGIGFLNGWSIMWVIGLIVTVLEIIAGFISILSGNFGVFISLIIDVLILFYLFRPNVKKFFMG